MVRIYWAKLRSSFTFFFALTGNGTNSSHGKVLEWAIAQLKVVRTVRLY